MTPVRPNPFRGLHDVFTEMERMRRLGRGGSYRADDPDAHGSDWVPVADIFADGADLVIRLEIPGVEPDTIAVTFGGGVLTVAGERAADPGDAVSFYARERRHGRFHRAVVLPEGVDQSMITASFENGVAEITVAGAARTPEPSRIPLQNRSTGRIVRRGSSRPE